VPELAVLRLEDPVSLIREVDEPRRHALALQRGEQLVPLADRHAEIEVVLDDQHRRLELAEVGGEPVRRVLLVGRAVLAPGPATGLPPRRPTVPPWWCPCGEISRGRRA